MSSIYPYAQIVHLFCAIIFVGYLFFDVVIFKIAKKRVPAELAEQMDGAIHSVGVKIMPICVLLLILTGGMMMSTWVNSDIGYFATTMQKLFMVKVVLGFLIFFAVVINLFCKFILKRKPILGNIHYFAIIASFVIVFLAKYMYIA